MAPYKPNYEDISDKDVFDMVSCNFWSFEFFDDWCAITLGKRIVTSNRAYNLILVGAWDFEDFEDWCNDQTYN